MKTIFTKFILCLVVLCFSCGPKVYYFPDEDDPGLSRFTAYGFNVATFYLNSIPYVNSHAYYTSGGITSSFPLITKFETSGTSDTVSLSWSIGINDNGSPNYNSLYQRISILLPVSKTFNKTNLIAMSGKQFASNTNTVTIQTSDSLPDTLTGLANIYFVKIAPKRYKDSTIYLRLSGLFNANIGDSILITKGRFDFEINEKDINF